MGGMTNLTGFHRIMVDSIVDSMDAWEDDAIAMMRGGGEAGRTAVAANRNRRDAERKFWERYPGEEKVCRELGYLIRSVQQGLELRHWQTVAFLTPASSVVIVSAGEDGERTKLLRLFSSVPLEELQKISHAYSGFPNWLIDKGFAIEIVEGEEEWIPTFVVPD